MTESSADAARPSGRPAADPKGDWPMARGGVLSGNRAHIRGKIRGTPEVAWRHELGRVPGSVLTADFDEDGVPETYAAENGRVVRRDGAGKVLWRSRPITRGFSLVGFEDLD